MTQDNVALVARGWEHLHATGQLLDAILALDFAWDTSTFRGWPKLQLHEGPDGVTRFLDEWSGAFDDWTIEPEALHDGGEKVVSVCHQTARAKITGVPVDMRFAMVFTVRDGLETRMEMYADPAEAFTAVGMDE